MDCGLETDLPVRPASADCGKRSQSGRPARAPEGGPGKTKPICGSQNIPPFQFDADCAKRTQFAPERIGDGCGLLGPGGPTGGQSCKTKPIPPDRQRGASALRERSYGELGMQKASAKRTQFAADGQGRPSPRPEALTLPPVPEQMRQTNPICPRIGARGVGRQGRKRPATRENVRNEASSGRAMGGIKCFVGKEL